MNSSTGPGQPKRAAASRAGLRHPRWLLALALLAILFGALGLTDTWWAPVVARSLTCDEDTSRSDALLIENFDPDYLVFERARLLRRAGVADRVLVPVSTDRGTDEPNAVALGTAELMARIARLGPFDAIPIPEEVEPISLNAAYRIREFLSRAQIHSVTVVSPKYRSRRSALVYGAALGPARIAVRCVPARSSDPSLWTRRWHGIQNVVEQWSKLQYYRWWVIPFLTK